MSEVRVPFRATAELLPPFMLDETYSGSNGVKSVLYDKSCLKVMGRLECADLPDYSSVQVLVYYVVGAIPFICNVFPVVPEEKACGVQEAASIFNCMEGNSASDFTESLAGDAFGWLSASGSVNVEMPIGGAGSIDDMPSIENVTVEDLAVANTLFSQIAPTEKAEAGDISSKRFVKWRGNFVIATT